MGKTVSVITAVLVGIGIFIGVFFLVSMFIGWTGGLFINHDLGLIVKIVLWVFLGPITLWLATACGGSIFILLMEMFDKRERL